MALLRESGEHAGTVFDLEAAHAGDGAASGVPHGDLLLAFAEAVLAGDAAALDAARATLRNVLGDAALVDAAATVASFNAVVKIADGTGIPIEEAKAAATADLRDALGLDRMVSAE